MGGGEHTQARIESLSHHLYRGITIIEIAYACVQEKGLPIVSASTQIIYGVPTSLIVLKKLRCTQSASRSAERYLGGRIKKSLAHHRTVNGLPVGFVTWRSQQGISEMVRDAPSDNLPIRDLGHAKAR